MGFGVDKGDDQINSRGKRHAELYLAVMGVLLAEQRLEDTLL